MTPDDHQRASAWQEAITELGTNGAGFRNADSAHPFEHLNPVGNRLQILQFLTLSASTCGQAS